MPCYHPLRACFVEGPGGRSISFDRSAVGRALSLPCGRCIGCKLEKARQWAVRLMHERELHDDACFLTLTYSPEFLPSDLSLSVSHAQKFLKRLRSRIAPRRVRFFLCGEYGEISARPHYHAIIFGFDFPDKVLLKGDGEFRLFRSDFLDEVWGLGFCSIGEVSFESAAYVANYATKKVTGKRAKGYYGGRVPEFLTMSRKPGIGRGWIDKFRSDVYPSDEVIVRGHKARPPRYYDKVAKDEDALAFQVIADRRSEYAESLEEAVVLCGQKMLINPGRNDRRLAVREVVAKAKLSLKSRNLE